MTKRRADNPDSNQAEIVDALRSVGCRVDIIGRPFDLLVARDGALCLMEVKNPEGKDKLSKKQIEDIDDFAYRGVEVTVVRSVDEAFAAIDVFLFTST